MFHVEPSAIGPLYSLPTFACTICHLLAIQNLSPLSRDNFLSFRHTPPTARCPMAKSLEVSPIKSVAEELDLLRKSFRESVNAYAKRIETQLAQAREHILAQNKDSKTQASRIRDLRDILTLCRTLDLKPDKGRRKDLKKVESALEEIQAMIQNW